MIDVVDDAECESCEQDFPNDRCSSSERPCGHHCNHSFTHDHCCWCGEEFGVGDGR